MSESLEKVLVIWEEIPEDMDLYLFERDENYARIAGCHGQYLNAIGCTAEDNVLWLHGLLKEMAPLNQDEIQKLVGHIWVVRTGQIL